MKYVLVFIFIKKKNVLSFAPPAPPRFKSWFCPYLHGRFSVPWICAGDFNEITKTHEKKGGRLRPYTQMKNFRDVLDECGLMDLGFEGSKFTWFKNFGNGVAIWEH